MTVWTGRFHFALVIAAIFGLIFSTSILNATNTSAASATADQSQPRFLDEQFLNIEKKIPGFSGYYFDEEGKVNVYSTSATSLSSGDVTSVLSTYLTADDLSKGLNIKQSTYPWSSWDSWRNTLTNRALQGNSSILYLDIDERAQTLMIGLDKADETNKNEINKFLADNGIPIDAVSIVAMGAPSLESHGETIIPRIGGIEIGYGFIHACTNGFIANRISDGKRVSGTAGHCEVVVDTAGDEVYVQPLGGSTVGTEIANTNLNGPRYSDSLLWEPNSGITTSLGKLYKTSTSQYTITGKKDFPAQGEAICKFGITTHETCGSVMTTGVNLFNADASPYGTLWMMDHANYSSAAGDSGGPVFKKGPGDTVTLYGIHRGRTIVGQTDYATFSPIHNVEIDQGTLQVNSPGFQISATEQSTGNAATGLNVVVLNPSGVQVANGYTPLNYAPTTTGTYTIRFNNYGSYYATTTTSASFINSAYVYSWGEEVKVSVTDLTASYPTNAIYYNDGNPGAYAKVIFDSEYTTGGAIPGMYAAIRDNTGTYLAKGFTPFTVGLPTGKDLTVAWNNYGTNYYQYADSTTTELSDVRAHWGGEQGIRLNVNGAFEADLGKYASSPPPPP